MPNTRDELFLDLADLLMDMKVSLSDAEKALDALGAADGDSEEEEPAKGEWGDFEGLHTDVESVTFRGQDGKRYRIERVGS